VERDSGFDGIIIGHKRGAIAARETVDDEGGGLLRLFQWMTGHRARAIDDQRQVQRRARVPNGRRRVRRRYAHEHIERVLNPCQHSRPTGRQSDLWCGHDFSPR
jgi:hypothetical protein